MNNTNHSKSIPQRARHHICRWCLLPLLLLLALPAAVEAQFLYTITNGTITVTKYNGSGGAVTIPDTISDLPVVGIGDYAFQGSAGLTSVSIPNSVTSIGNGAFQACGSLTNVTIGNAVASIGIIAFAQCDSLITVAIPDSVISIGVQAFYGNSLRAITVDALNAVYSSPDGVLCDKSQTTLIQCPGAKAGSYVIPNSITSIRNFALEGCTRLTSVTIPNCVTNIGVAAFRFCGGLMSVTIPDGVTSISDDAFFCCTSLTHVTLGNGVTRIGDGSFFQCGLTSLRIPDSVTTIGDAAFNDCARLTNLTIPNSVTNIGNSAFNDCQSLTILTVPDSVTSIGTSAFASCLGLTNVMIGNGVINVGEGAFNYCPNLIGITMGSGVTSIGRGAFSSCTRLTSITIPNSVTSIGAGAFYSCTSLAALHFAGNAPSLDGPAVFQGDYLATVYYLPGTTGWGATYGGLPTALWTQVPILQSWPQSQTAEAASAVGLRLQASSLLPLFYFWYLNATNLLSSGTNWQLQLTNLELSQSGAYTVVISNVLGAVTSAPVMVQVIAPVEHRPVPGVKLMGATGSQLNVDYADSLVPAPNWTPLGSVSLTSTSQYCFDLTLPLPPQRFYRAWETGTPGGRASLDLHLVPAITLTGTIGHSVRVDAINQLGPTDAWFTLETVTLTNTSQLYFDTSAWRQPQRLYRLMQVP